MHLSTAESTEEVAVITDRLIHRCAHHSWPGARSVTTCDQLCRRLLALTWLKQRVLGLHGVQESGTESDAQSDATLSGRLPISLTPWVRVSGDDATASATTDSTVANSASAAVATVGHTSRERE